MIINFSIRVVNEDGEGLENIPIEISYPFTHSKEFTDEDGWANFEKDTMMHSGIRADIYVGDSIEAKNIWLGDGDTLSYTLE